MVAADRSPLADADPVDVQATFCSTLVDQWLRLGVRHAVVAPGSRSTPMAIAFTERSEMTVHVVHDERVAAFTALGLGLPAHAEATAVPALLLCTSGTAAANFLPAIAEAGLSAVPMIVLTADRPEELRGVGAPQTIDQHELYGSHTRWFCDPGVPEAAMAHTWRPLATSAWNEATVARYSSISPSGSRSSEPRRRCRIRSRSNHRLGTSRRSTPCRPRHRAIVV